MDTTITDRPAAAAAPRPPTRHGWIASVLVVATVVLLAAAAVFIALDIRASDRADRDRAVLVASREEVLALVNVNPQNATPSFDRAITGATGAWKQQLVQSGGALTGTVNQAQLNVRAAVTEAGITQADDDHATTVLALQLFVGNAEGPPQAPRPLRVRLNLDHEGDSWLVSSLEFIS
jgi:Mce-associated membrane protein